MASNFGSKEIQAEVMGRIWLSIGLQLVFFGTLSFLAYHPPGLRGKRSSVTYSIKHSAGNILTDENEILSRWSILL